MKAQVLAQRPTIKILLYTDDPDTINEGKDLLGLDSMIERLKAHAPVFADLSIKWVSRSSDANHHADNKLDVVMRREVTETGEPFDEIWFFGLHQANTEKSSSGVFRGGPESELTPDEVDELEKWMKVEGGSGGGVLMTGDHNNPIPPHWIPNENGRCADTIEEVELLGLGRAIGRCVPRAGDLRKWYGPPSSGADDSVSTVANPGLQSDRKPQRLIHELVNGDGEPDPHGKPHPLFFYRAGKFIDIFPDHRHEGALNIPDLSNTAVWPVGPSGQPKPLVVAFGTDTRSGEKIGLVIAYEGDRAGVGRIVADSSWHHYVNINLKGFPHPARLRSYSDKIGQFYGNLAIWLAPMHKRRQMAQAMYWELAKYTLLEQHDDPVRMGAVAYSLLGRSTSPCEINELLRSFGPQQGLAKTEQEALGLVLDSYQKAMIRSEEGTVPIGSLELEDIVVQGLPRAKAAAAAVSASSARIDATNGATKMREQQAVATSTEAKEWTIEIKRDSQPGKPPFTATLVFNLNAQNEVITGQVWDGVERRLLSTVKGTHKPLPGAAQSFMALEFKWGQVNVALLGVTDETAETIHFTGRYRATAVPRDKSKGKSETMDGVSPLEPGDGDTGSGTGQQT